MKRVRQRHAGRDRRLIVHDQVEIDLPRPILEPLSTFELADRSSLYYTGRRFFGVRERIIDVALHAFDDIDDPGRLDRLIDVGNLRASRSESNQSNANAHSIYATHTTLP